MDIALAGVFSVYVSTWLNICVCVCVCSFIPFKYINNSMERRERERQTDRKIDWQTDREKWEKRDDQDNEKKKKEKEQK